MLNSLKFQKYKYTPHRGLWMSSKELPKIRKEIKNKIEKIGYRDVRRARIPFHEALIKELYEDNCIEFANYFEILLDKEKYLYSNGKISKKFSENNDLLNILAKNFHDANDELHVNRDLINCLNIIYQLSDLIESNFTDNKWLSKECFQIALELQTKHKELSNDEQETKLRLRYGRFCLERLFSFEDAIEQLEIAKKMSKEITFLTTGKLFDYLHKDSCYCLAQSYLAEANKNYHKNLAIALNLTQAAILCLIDFLDNESREQTLYIKINLRHCQFLIKKLEYSEALEILTNIEKVIFATGDALYECELFLLQGICYFGLNNLSRALSRLNHVIQLAQANNLLNQKGLALVEITKIYAKNNDTFELAEESLNQAMTIFKELKDVKNSEKANYFSAILKSQKIFPNYIKLIKNDNSPCDMLKLTGWKDFLKPFWIEEENNNEKWHFKCILKEMEYIKNKKF